MVNFPPKANNSTMMKHNLALREKRTATRYPVALFVEFKGGLGWTIDISASGVLIETRQPFSYGSVIAFSVLQPKQHDDAAPRLYCQGEVVRVEQEGDVWRVGVCMGAIRFQG